MEFAQGRAPQFVYACARSGRLLCLPKSGGGIRPLVITAALRRIALKAVLAVITPSAAEELGSEQFAVGRPNAVVEMTHGLEAENAIHGKAVIGFDIANAFGSMSRGAMGEDFVEIFPALADLVSILLSTATPLLWEDAEGQIHEILSHTGLDQGCPLSLLLFLFGMRRVLRRARQILQQQGLAPELVVSIRGRCVCCLQCQQRWRCHGSLWPGSGRAGHVNQ